MTELYEGIPFESDSELYALYWLLELKSKSFIESIERAPEILLSSPLVNKFTQVTKLKTKENTKEIIQNILQPHYYTAEFKVKWNNNTPPGILWDISNLSISKFNSLFISHSINVDTSITYIEVKPVFDFQNKNSWFKLNQKWAWASRGVYINLIQPDKLFKSTFTPREYLNTRKKKTERQIKWPIITCDQYLLSLNQ